MQNARQAARQTYAKTRIAVIRGLGLVYMSAFGSLAVQVDGLIGSRGILPAAELFDQARRALGPGLARMWLLPSLLWIDASDRMLHFLCWGGVLMAVALVLGVLPGPLLSLLWLSYLSLTVAGQVFLGYQWDSLLLEAGFLCILLAPWGLWTQRAKDEPWWVTIGLLRWLVFRLMFLSGVVKLSSGDPTWRVDRAGVSLPDPAPADLDELVHPSTSLDFSHDVRGLHVLRRANRLVLYLRPQSDSPGWICVPRTAADIDRRHRELWLLQFTGSRSLPIASG